MAKDEQKTAAPTTPSTPLNLRQKLVLARKTLSFVEKRGRNDHFHYDYTQAADIQGLVGKALADVGIALGMRNLVVNFEIGKTKSNSEETICRLSCEYGFLDADSAEEIWYPAFGEGRDPSDKALYKARTGAMKYFLVQSLCVGMGDDPENDDENDRVNNNEEHERRSPEPRQPKERKEMTVKQAKEIAALLEETKVAPTDEKMLAYWKVESVEQCPFEGLKAQLLKKRKQMSDVAVKAGASAPAEQPNADANDKTAQEAHLKEMRQPGDEG